MSINKFQRSMLTFSLSAKLNVIILESRQYIQTVSQKPLEQLKTTYDRLSKIHTNCSGHTIKMAAIPILGVNLLEYLLLWNQKDNGLGTCYVGSTGFAQMMNLG